MIELMVVMALVGLLAGVAVPQLGPSLAAARLKSASHDVASALRKARGLAIGRHTECRFTLNVQLRRYSVCDQKRPYALPSSIDLKLFAASQEMPSENEGSIVFYADGSSTGGRVSFSAAERQRYIDVSWLTGMVLEQSGDAGSQ